MSWSINPYSTGLTAGTAQVSAKYPLDKLTLIESSLVHPTHSDGFVDRGDPVYCNGIVGVCEKSATAATDYVTVATKGIWNLTATAASAITVGTQIYIVNASGALTTSNSSATAFGKALGALASGSGVIPIAVGL